MIQKFEVDFLMEQRWREASVGNYDWRSPAIVFVDILLENYVFVESFSVDAVFSVVKVFRGNGDEIEVG